MKDKLIYLEALDYKCLIVALRLILTRYNRGENVSMGLCLELSDVWLKNIRFGANSGQAQAAWTWFKLHLHRMPGGTGDSAFPVPWPDGVPVPEGMERAHPVHLANEAFRTLPHWSGPYGEQRIKLLNWLIDRAIEDAGFQPTEADYAIVVQTPA